MFYTNSVDVKSTKETDYTGVNRMTDKKQDTKQDTKDQKHDQSKAEQHKAPEYKSDAELVAMLQRLQADFENYKKRIDKEKSQIVIATTAKIVSLFLPIIDAAEMAVKHDKDNKGLNMIKSELHKTLASLHITPIPAMGKRLDPLQHEVLLQEERADAEDEVILEELQRGYKMGDYIIRTSKVKIARKIEPKPKEDHEHGNQPQQKHAVK